MEKWEYCTEFMWADVESEGVREYFKATYPSWKKQPRYTPHSMEQRLDQLGERGWELVHMQPVKISDDHRVMFGDGISNIYFCVLKRRKPE